MRMAILEMLVTRAREGWLEAPDLVEQKEKRDLLEIKEKLGRQEQMERGVTKDQRADRAREERLENRAFKVPSVPVDQREAWVIRELMEHREILVQTVLKVFWARKELREVMEDQEKWEHRERLDYKVLQEIRAQMESLVRLVTMVKEVHLGPKELLERSALTEIEDKREWQDSLGFRGHLDAKEKQAKWDPLEGVAKMVLMGVRDPMVNQEVRVLQAKEASREKVVTEE